MPRFILLVLAVALCVCYGAASHGGVHFNVTGTTASGQSTIWTTLGTPVFPNLTVNCGDTVFFQWSGFHDAKFKDGATGTCTTGQALQNVGIEPSLPGNYTLQITSSLPASIFAYCSVGSHCLIAQRFYINNLCAAGASASSPKPSSSPMPKMTMPMPKMTMPMPSLSPKPSPSPQANRPSTYPPTYGRGPKLPKPAPKY